MRHQRVCATVAAAAVLAAGCGAQGDSTPAALGQWAMQFQLTAIGLARTVLGRKVGSMFHL